MYDEIQEQEQEVGVIVLISESSLMCIERSVKRSGNWTKEMMHAWFNMSLTLSTYNNNCSLKYTIVKQLSI